ncbi:hypothetical protein [Psychromonas algicola]|uniref:hypothetical protein n=1 Tax=Psychromonas algicola TaxID=2555642 RepID=UPI001067FA63|nr:hypothetical protein [Psychromonas sp. RZ5]TEW51511.1 hypothetical protein E2R67_07015 [Psychromonas sp. RZ5]
MSRVFIIIFAFFSLAVRAEDNFVEKFVVGDYLLIGEGIDTQQTYSGKVSIYLEERKLKVKRIIDGQSIVGVASFESVLSGESKALRIRFQENNIRYEESCLWGSDLDNYARISCYLYIPGADINKPGLEALFINHAQ